MLYEVITLTNKVKRLGGSLFFVGHRWYPLKNTKGKSGSGEQAIDIAQPGDNAIFAQGHDDIKHGRAGQLSGQDRAHGIDENTGFNLQFLGHGSTGLFRGFGAKFGKLIVTLSQLRQPRGQIRMFKYVFVQRFGVDFVRIGKIGPASYNFV